MTRTRYTAAELIGMVLLTFVVVAFGAWATMRDTAGMNAHASPIGVVNTCNAPCVVAFGPNMHEDEFDIAYNGNGTLYVNRVEGGTGFSARR